MITYENFKDIRKNKMDYLMALDRGKIKGLLGDVLIEKLSKKEETSILTREIDGNYYVIKVDIEKKKEKMKTRRQGIQRLEEELDKLAQKLEEDRYRLKEGESLLDYVGEHIGRIKEQSYYSKYLKSWSFDRKKGELNYEIDTQLIEKEEMLDGLFVLRTNNKSLKEKRSVGLYKNLTEVEGLFKNLKSVLKIRPIYHYNEKHVKGHIYLSVMSYILQNYISYKLSKEGVTRKFEKIVPHLQNITVSPLLVNGKKLKDSVCGLTEYQKEILGYFDMTRRKITKLVVGNK